MAHLLMNAEDLEEARTWLQQASGVEPPAEDPPAGADRRSRSHHRRQPAVHLLLGDSVARDSQLLSRYPGDLLINRARGGATWASTLERLKEDLKPWEHETSTFNLEKGAVILWLSGNDVHRRSTGVGFIDGEVLEQMSRDIRQLLDVLKEKGPKMIIILGPLPRLCAHVDGIAWERTASYHMERATKRTVDQTEGASMTTLGRSLTKKKFGRHSVRSECGMWFKDDGVHLNQCGYRKLDELLPVWLRFGGDAC
ncbi:hypothetical protein FJT64_009915 [Amphibalanus amphitrite]|uniref:SGNH hydrolase-type esterase domain-containing protein n=1 Tax=Amphibalanus amphitrite TaxID=1232801 RepID=A0A6A4VRZ7_AMPAM|nr:hypothetical protein FJT64_009915 [Amphibalanus amphitrite]